MQLTTEQSAVVTASQGKRPHIAVHGYAGAAKTTTMLAVAAAKPRENGRAFFFNKSMAVEMQQRIEREGIAGLQASTLHSLAYREMIRRFGKARTGQNLRAGEIVRALSIGDIRVEGVRKIETPDQVLKAATGRRRGRKSKAFDGDGLTLTASQVAYIALRSFERWCNSGDAVLAERHMHAGDFEISTADRDRVRRAVLPVAQRLSETVLREDGALAVPHHGYLKAYVEGLASGDIRVSRWDYVIGDEFQDSNGVTIKFMNLMRDAGMQTIIAGDPFQQIYGWRGSVNAMSAIPFDRELELTQSFRFGQPVADLASAVLRQMGSRVQLRGNPARKTVIVGEPGSRAAFNDEGGNAILCRTNAGVIEAALIAMQDGQECYIPKAKTMLDRVQDILTLKRGGQAMRTELRQFPSYDHFCEFIALDDGAVEWKQLDRLLGDYGEHRLLTLLEGAQDSRGSTITITTAHGAKGMQWPRVQLWGDFPEPDEGQRRDWDEELRLLYVALTRAQEQLDITRVPVAQTIAGKAGIPLA
ncbi:MAG: 3'-5' exonuclease [Sinobacteraceae bacterium]|nr:3'-5' exonuclease [Nevskiaceae bacterium]